MALDKNTLAGGILLVGLYIIVAQPFATTLATAGISVLLFAVTKSEAIVLGFMIASLFVRQINQLFIPTSPVGIEAFQARDAASVHTRIQTVAQKPPPIQAITGVLESPDILDNTPLMAMDGTHGVPGASIPASSRGRALINPLAEGFQNTPNASLDTNPVANPVLQYGEDNDAVDTAMIDEGTDMPIEVPSSDMAAM